MKRSLVLSDVAFEGGLFPVRNDRAAQASSGYFPTYVPVALRYG
jgi:hypothetical protein